LPFEGLEIQMRKATIILLPLTLIFSSCDQNARDFAKNAKAILDDYAARIDLQIQAESQYYQRDAVFEVKHQHENLQNSVKADRGELGSELAVELSVGSKSPLRARSYLRDYAQSEYTRRRAAYTGEVDATRQYLAKLQLLQADKDRVQALGKLLDGLSKKLSLTAEVGAVKQAVSDTKTDFDKLICDDIATKLKAAPDNKSLLQLQKDRKCPAGGAK
jgi:hypothetical protein